MVAMPCMNPLLFCLASLTAAEGDADRSRPNVVIVYCDDMGYGDIGPYGAKKIRTPHLDKLAASGRKFTNFHVAQPVCSASRTALLTGCYPNRLGLHGALGPNARHGIAASEETLAELVKRAGYQTAAVGKWHLGHLPPFLPTRHGFDRYLGLPYSNDMWPFHPEAKAGTYPPLPLLKGEKVINPQVTAADQAKLTGQYTDFALEFLQDAAKKKAPFLLYLAHSMPHVPLFAGEKFLGKSAAGLYGDVIEEIDDSVGRIVAELTRTGTLENTWIIFSSDNGPWLSYGEHAGSSGPWREGKGTCFEGGLRVPCIMSWPGVIAPHTVSDANFMTIDILPTLAGRLKMEHNGPSIDGKDVWNWIMGKEAARNPHEGYAYYFENNQLQAVSSADGRYKLQLPHAYRTLAGKPGGKDGKPALYQNRKIEKPELYDLIEDPSEIKDIADRQAQEFKALLDFAQKCRADMGDTLTQTRGTGQREQGRATP
jgi:arylsulfatase A